MPDDEEVILGSNGVVEWCTRELTVWKTQGLIALSLPEARTVGIEEAKFVQSILLDWGATVEIETFVDNSTKDRSRWHATHGNQMDTCGFRRNSVHNE